MSRLIQFDIGHVPAEDVEAFDRMGTLVMLAVKPHAGRLMDSLAMQDVAHAIAEALVDEPEAGRYLAQLAEAAPDLYYREMLVMARRLVAGREQP